MSVAITLSDTLAAQLQSKAQLEHLSMQDLAIKILSEALRSGNEDFLTPEEVVARIKATPPNLANIRPARASLAEALEYAPDDPEFDAERTRNWAEVEAEMKAISRANAAAEGRN